VQRLLLLISVWLVSAACSEAQAAEKRVYLIYAGSQADRDVLAQESGRFRAAITDLSAQKFSADREMDQVMADCREQLGLSPAAERECLLTASRRVMVYWSSVNATREV